MILGQIRSTEFRRDDYPSHEMICDIKFGKEWVPSYLRVFMTALIKNELKQVGIGQAIVNAVKPNRNRKGFWLKIDFD